MNRLLIAALLGVLATACQGTSVTSPSSMDDVTAQPSAASQTESTPAARPTASIPSVPPAESPAEVAPVPPATDADAMRFTWSEVPFEGSVSAIAGDGSRFVAVGAGSDGVSSWTSSDGSAWEQHNVPERSFGPIGDGSGRDHTAGMGQLVRLDDTLYSFGGFHLMDSETAVAWRWTDGSEWELIESASSVFSGGITQVTASDDALFAINSGFSGGPRLMPGTTWLWTPATSWVQTPLTSSEDEEIAVEVSVWGNGTFVAAGSSAPKVEGVESWDWPRTPSMWRSLDGLAWTAIEPPAGMASVCSLTARPGGGFVALGTTNEGGASWTSMDGGDWVKGTIGLPGSPEVSASEQDATPCSVVAYDGGLLASASLEDATLTWTSRDGANWSFDQRLDIVGVHADTMAALRDQLLLSGYRVDPQAEGGLSDVLLGGTGSPTR